MERRNAVEPISALQKRLIGQNLKIRNQNFQQRDDIIPNTFALEEKIDNMK